MAQRNNSNRCRGPVRISPYPLRIPSYPLPPVPTGFEQWLTRLEVRLTLPELARWCFSKRFVSKVRKFKFLRAYSLHYNMVRWNEGLDLLQMIRDVFADAAVKYVKQLDKYKNLCCMIAHVNTFWDNAHAEEHNVPITYDLGMEIWRQRPVVWARIRRGVRMIGFIMRMWRGVTAHNNEKKYAPGTPNYKECERNFYASLDQQQQERERVCVGVCV